MPPEVLVTTMRTNQKYLALRTPDGALAPRFVLVANMEASDGGAAIVAGNERVLRARLWDAKFFWDQDRKVVAREPPAEAWTGWCSTPSSARRASGSSGWWR